MKYVVRVEYYANEFWYQGGEDLIEVEAPNKTEARKMVRQHYTAWDYDFKILEVNRA